MNGKMPHIVQYQGSKRKLAPQILQYMPAKFNRLIEPFAGMAAITIATASENMAEHYIINDLNAPLLGILKEAVENPERIVEEYRYIWNEQFSYKNHILHFYDIRESFNNGDESPAKLLYLLARCVKGSVRYGKNGKFNQSPDKRRHGTNPDTIAKNIYIISGLLKGKASFFSTDYREMLAKACPGDIVYMDPPYQGVSGNGDCRYLKGVSFQEFAESLDILNKKRADYIISYDGSCGDKQYGCDLPESLGCKKIMLKAGLSTQALLLGNKNITMEALYISRGLIPVYNSVPKQLLFTEAFA
jgi:DNA adenine methylase